MLLYVCYIFSIFLPFLVSITLLLLNIFFTISSVNFSFFKFTFNLRQAFLSFIILMAFLDFWYFLLLLLFSNFAKISLFSTSFINFKWIYSNLCILEWGFTLDFLSLGMLSLVSCIAGLVICFSLDYMSHDPQQLRFMSLLFLFTWTMFLLVSADNLIQLFFGWEFVGVCSYLLINFWHTRIFANLSAMKAIIMNRIGDFGLLCAILLIYFNFHSFKFSVLASLCTIHAIDDYILFFISFFLLIAAFGKSAQLFLHTWLPDAMEGPTPVSALIHAATMVTAGVFLVIRCSFFFENSMLILFILGFISSLTAVFASTCGLFQNDIKKVIAYSTCSQLGFMFFCCSCSAFHIAFFHLATHAFFKALLFLCAGSIIHSLGGEQDIRRMGGLFYILPFTYQCFFWGSLSLMGFPFLSGFYSKDLIIEIGFFADWVSHTYFMFLMFIALCGTICYSLRLFYLVFLQKPAGHYSVYSKISECTNFIFFALFILWLGAIFFGHFFVDLFCGLGCSFSGSIDFSAFFFCQYFVEFLNYKLRLISTIAFFFISIVFFFLIFFNFSKKFKYFKFRFFRFFFLLFFNILSIFNKKWFFDSLFVQYMANSINWFSFHVLFVILDRGLLEFFGPFGIILWLSKISKSFLFLSTGRILDYLASFFICLLFLLLLV